MAEKATWREGQQARICGALWGALHYTDEQRSIVMRGLGTTDYTDNATYREVVREVGQAWQALDRALWDATEICGDISIEKMLDFHEGRLRDKRHVVEGATCAPYDGHRRWVNISDSEPRFYDRRYSSREECRLDSLR